MGETVRCNSPNKEKWLLLNPFSLIREKRNSEGLKLVLGYPRERKGVLKRHMFSSKVPVSLEFVWESICDRKQL